MENEKRTTVSTEAASAKTSAKSATTKSAAAKAATDTSEPVKAKATRSRRASSAVTSTSGGTKAAAAPAAVVAETPAAPAAVVAETPAAETAAAEPAAAAKKAPTRRSRAKKATPVVEAASEPSLLDAIAEPKAPAKRTTRRRATSPVTAPSAAASDQGVQGELSLSAQETPAVEAAPVEAAEPIKAPAKRTRRAKAPVTSTAAPAVEKAVEVPAAVVVEEPSAPEVPAATVATEPAELAEAPAAKRPARRSRRAAAPAQSAASAPTAVIAVAEPAETVAPAAVEAPAEAAPARSGSTRNRRRSSAASGPATPAPELTAPVAEPATEAAAEAEPAAAVSDTGSESLFLSPAAGMSALFLAPDLSLAVPAATESSEDSAKDGNDGDRRGRGRNRNRRRNETEQADALEPAEAELDDEEATDDGVTSRRRRRRRRGDQDLELTGGTDEDPPNTVTRVRAPRTPSVVEAGAGASDRVTSLRGSTRLEAKKQRRRDSRDSGRRRTVITEAEFLARRESVDRVMVVRQSDDRIQIGVLEDGILAEHFVSKTQQDSLIGNVYLGKVQNVLPSMEAAFVDIGRGRNAVLYAGEVDWDAADLKGQPRRIENALKSGDSVLVQVSKDPVGHKGARLTSQISLPGRYLVFVPGGSMTGISRKLPDVERNRLKRVLKDHLPENAGVIVRTAAEGASEEELTNDINRLRAQWAGINERATSHKTLAPEMLYGEPDLTIKVVRDVFNEDFSKLVVSGEDAWDTIEAYVTYVAPDLLDRLEKWSKSEDIFAAHRIDEQINKALERKVFLPSGGSLVIDRTEAMTVVDVNTGKFTGSGGNLEETVTKNNLEAAEEVVRQLRLRDIGGIIVIDFIDMVLESNRDLVLRRLVECLGRDRTKHQVAEVTSLGLVQMTRKRMGTGLLEVFGELCPSCAGRGMVTHEIPVEHRRSHSPAVEVAQMHTHVPAPKQEPRENERTANRSTRSERKRNRNRNQPSEAETAPEVTPVVVTDEVSDAAKAQKATEARAALANIAAAAAASHQERVAAEAAPEQSTTSDDAATLTLGGEAIELPRGHRSESSEFAGSNTVDRAAALADLTQALDQLVAPGATPATEASVSSDEEGETNGNSRSRSRRGRRNRSARSAQGSTDSAVETSGLAPAAQGSSAQSSVVAEKVAAPVVKKSSEPIILGVGVPASEL